MAQQPPVRIAASVLLSAVALSQLVGCASPSEEQSRHPAVASTVNRVGLLVDAPTSYNPCTDVPDSLLKSERMVKGIADNRANAEGPDGVKWRGCRWVVPGGYAVAIQTTNMTLPHVRKTWYFQGREVTIGGRPAVMARRNEDRPRQVCSINVEIHGGSLEFHFDNPPSNRDTGHIDTCELGLALAEKVVPTLPAGA